MEDCETIDLWFTDSFKQLPAKIFECFHISHEIQEFRLEFSYSSVAE